MIPKDKAEDLIQKFMPYQDDYYNDEPRDGAISCALIAVDEVIEALREHHWQNRLIIDYWEEVKHKIENYG
jgi:hypothetical protein